MRAIRIKTDLVVWHCSATKPDWNGHAADIAQMHKAKGWDDIGYHLVISREGRVGWGEDPRKQGAHAKGVNMRSIAVCMVGGVDENGKAENNFTAEQWLSAKATFQFLLRMYPAAEHVGHRDLSPDLDNDGRISFDEFMKECPCFSVKQWIEKGFDAVTDLHAPWEMDTEVAVPKKKRKKKVKFAKVTPVVEEEQKEEDDASTDTDTQQDS